MIKENVVYGLSVSIPTPEESAGWFLYKKLIKYAYYDKCFEDEVTGKYISYKQFLQLSCGLAEALKKSNTNPNDVLAICSENNIYFFVAVMAGLFTGLTITTINPIYTENELSHAVNLTQPSTIFCTKTFYEKFLHLKAKYGFIKELIVINGDQTTPNVGLIDFLEKYNTINTDIYSFYPKSLNSRQHVAFIMFSSGTTGLPKGVMITHHNVNSRLMTQYDPNIWHMTSNPHAIGILPFFHAFGLQMALGYLFDGRMIHVLQQFDPAVYLKCIDKYRIEAIIAVPTLLQFLGMHPLVDKFDLSCLKDIPYGSSAASRATLDAVTKRLGVRPRQGYGLTECTMGVSATPPGMTKNPDSVGVLYPGMQGCICDPDTGKKLGPNQSGEICLKGGLVMKGYYRNEAATKESFTEDGYLRTGDIGHYDDNEYFYIVDRLKELIKYKSFQVAPAELEAVLITHPKIKQVAVVGLPDERDGELPLAFVVKELNAELTEDEVKSYLASFLSSGKHLRGGVIFVNEIPVNALGKILRREMRKLLPKIKSKL